MSARGSKLVKGTTGDWEIVIGMEVHAQVLSESKLFSGASTSFGAEPNSQVSFVDAAMPGMLPVINGKCVEQAVRTGLGLKAKINLTSVFDRKNYFYPDLPAGYQISQYKNPIVGEGEVTIDLAGGESRLVGIERLHLEQDAGKSLHDQHPDHSYVDLNRAGVALMEIVTKPDMRSSEEAAAFLRKLRAIVRYLGTCDGNMDEGSMRADVNVSVRKPGGALGTRCEIKNVNSMRFIAQAVEYEARRQVDIIEGGGTIQQETRQFDARAGETRSMRSKEDAHDYRYFPDPDLLPLELEQAWVDAIASTLPELPDEKKARFTGHGAVGLRTIASGARGGERDGGLLRRDGARTGADAKALAANWLNKRIFRPAQSRRSDACERSDLRRREQRDRSDDRIERHLRENCEGSRQTFSGMNPAPILAQGRRGARNCLQVTDTNAIEQAVDKIIAANPGTKSLR